MEDIKLIIDPLRPIPAIIYQNMEEYWLDINLPKVKHGLYKISTHGRCINNKGIFINPMQINSGYYVFALYTNTRRENGTPIYVRYLVQRVMMMTFVPILNPKNYTVNHIDGVKSHNWLWNLEWSTQRNNNIHSWINNLNTKCSNVRSDNDVESICKYIVNHPKASNREIFENVFLKRATDADKVFISNIRNKKSFKIINNKYF